MFTTIKLKIDCHFYAIKEKMMLLLYCVVVFSIWNCYCIYFYFYMKVGGNKMKYKSCAQRDDDTRFSF